jgi:SAM-dependent methyltransferase
MQERHTNKQLYFNEQAFTTEKFVIPFISNNFSVSDQINVLEIGCGEGGNLKPFLDLGCSVTGIDLAESKIKVAIKSFEDHPNSAKARFIARDIYLAEGDINNTFDLIIMRDVIEHIHNQELFMGYVKRFLKPGGVFFLAFPPWYNPFGGHQQVANSKILSKLPYFHLFPKNIYRFILKAGGETQEKIDGFLEIKDTGISIERFRKIVKQHGYHIITETMFFINPNYNIKFGLKPRKQAGIITAIPFFRNFVVTACYYLIKLKD